MYVNSVLGTELKIYSSSLRIINKRTSIINIRVRAFFLYYSLTDNP